MEHLRQQCGPHVTAVAKDSVEGICSKIYQLSAEYSRRLRQTHLSLLQDPPTGTYTHKPAARPPPSLHRYSPVLCVLFCHHHHIMCSVCVQRRVHPRSSPGWSTVIQCVWRSPRPPSLESSCILRTTWPVCASEERWSKSTEDTSANWSVLMTIL